MSSFLYQCQMSQAESRFGRYPSKLEVATINNNRLAALTTPMKVYQAHDLAGTNSKGFRLTPGQATECLDRNTIWVAELSVKVGAMVMLITVSRALALVV